MPKMEETKNIVWFIEEEERRKKKDLHPETRHKRNSDLLDVVQ